MIKYRLHWSLHPLKDQDWYINECKRMTEDEIARDLEINYASSVSGKVFSPFREDRHITPVPIVYNPSLPVYRVWDFGRTNAILYAQIDVYNRKRILHERVMGSKGVFAEFEEPSNITEQLRVAISDSENLFPDCNFIDICDPAGSFEDERGAKTEVVMLQEEGIYPQYDRILSLPTRERKERGRKMIMRDLQSTPGGKEAFKMYCCPNLSAGCITLKKAFQGGYCFRKDANGNITDRIKEPNHPYEDVIDCLIYLYLETDGYISVDEAIYEPWENDPYHNPFTGY